MACPGYRSSQTNVESHSNINLCLMFYLKAYLPHIASVRKTSNGSLVSSLFIGNNRQHIPVFEKMIFSWIPMVFSIAKVHMPFSNLWGMAVSAALAAGASLVSILESRDFARISTSARHYISIYITTTDWHLDLTQHAVLGFSE